MEVSLSGKINMKLEATRNVEMPYLPRFGLRLFLDERMDQVEYLAMDRMKITQTNIRAVISVCSEQTRKLCMKIT